RLDRDRARHLLDAATQQRRDPGLRDLRRGLVVPGEHVVVAALLPEISGTWKVLEMRAQRICDRTCGSQSISFPTRLPRAGAGDRARSWTLSGARSLHVLAPLSRAREAKR